MTGIRTADSVAPEQVRLVAARKHAAGAMKHFTDLDAAMEQLFARGLNVRDDQVQALGIARCCRSNILAEDDRASGARGRELDHPEILTAVEVGIESPPKSSVELLRTIYIRDRNDDDFELHVEYCGVRAANRFIVNRT